MDFKHVVFLLGYRRGEGREQDGGRLRGGPDARTPNRRAPSP
ncbi:hypothetical protein BV133_1587 [Blastochloris viridis]|uniref:Uncharacterized protein n=1 Tax=Blastochloris viridis TaxID=1079 RepID=A0A182D120_BLAVI|nr:hypothetical protein BV133_1587 [Blastochloris viridis]